MLLEQYFDTRHFYYTRKHDVSKFLRRSMLAGWCVVHNNTIHSENISIQIRILSSFSNINSNLFPSRLLLSRRNYYRFMVKRIECYDMINQIKKKISQIQDSIPKMLNPLQFSIHEHIYFYIRNFISKIHIATRIYINHGRILSSRAL